jgi:hypothetical protein
MEWREIYEKYAKKEGIYLKISQRKENKLKKKKETKGSFPKT